MGCVNEQNLFFFVFLLKIWHTSTDQAHLHLHLNSVLLCQPEILQKQISKVTSYTLKCVYIYHNPVKLVA